MMVIRRTTGRDPQMTQPIWHGLTIRPSLTSGYHDCALRGLCRGYPHLFTKLGYTLRSTTASLAAGIGTGVHAGANYTLREKLERDWMGSEADAGEQAIGALRQATEEGFQPDDTSPSMNVAEQQVLRMTRLYRAEVAPKITPVLVEVRREADAGDGFLMSGQADVVALEPGGIDDLKTGALERSAMAQLGCYDLIYRAHGFEVNWLRQTFLPRVLLSKPQPAPVEIYYDPTMAERVAEARIKQIKRDIIELCETGDPVSVPSNPGSSLCSAKWCPAHGTDTCRMHKGAQ